ncbi:MAG: GNAT family N-acetyltransferase [Treponema sp.]|nr:GNAT family N-acetyltransferase [Treponema sp.]
MIRFIVDTSERKRVSRLILESLPEWFEVESEREKYIAHSVQMPFFAAYENDSENPVGFLCLRQSGTDTMELAVMGVKPEFHRRGYGRNLFDAARDYARRNGFSFMLVKTVRYGMFDCYDKTNAFYRSVGFKELDVIESVWGKENPCQLYVLNLHSAIQTMAARHSYRGTFAPDAVSLKDLKIIAAAGLDAPSGCNKQTTDIVIVNDDDTLNKIKAVLDPPVAQTAPAMIVVLSRKIYAYRDRCFSVQDYSAAIENMLLAIVELGYQSCWYEGHITDKDRICDKIGSILHVPEEYDVVCILPVGKALDDVRGPRKKTFPERVRFNSWK